MSERCLRAGKVAARLGVSVQAVGKWVHRGCPHDTVLVRGAHVKMFSEREVRDWRDAHCDGGRGDRSESNGVNGSVAVGSSDKEQAYPSRAASEQRLAFWKARAQEVETLTKEGTLVSVEEVRMSYTQRLTRMERHLSSVARATSAQIVSAIGIDPSERVRIQDIIGAQMREAIRRARDEDFEEEAEE